MKCCLKTMAETACPTLHSRQGLLPQPGLPCLPSAEPEVRKKRTPHHSMKK